jgi:hypothetical protein
VPRILTYNVRDFVDLHRLGLPGGQLHAGIVLISVHTIRQDDIGGQLRALERFLNDHAEPAVLRGQLHWLAAVG